MSTVAASVVIVVVVVAVSLLLLFLSACVGKCGVAGTGAVWQCGVAGTGAVWYSVAQFGGVGTVGFRVLRFLCFLQIQCFIFSTKSLYTTQKYGEKKVEL